MDIRRKNVELKCRIQIQNIEKMIRGELSLGKSLAHTFSVSGGSRPAKTSGIVGILDFLSSPSILSNCCPPKSNIVNCQSWDLTDICS